MEAEASESPPHTPPLDTTLHPSHLEKFRDACILAFTEPWLTSADPDTDLTLTGFGKPVRLDRDADVTVKSQGGGVCLYVSSGVNTSLFERRFVLHT